MKPLQVGFSLIELMVALLLGLLLIAGVGNVLVSTNKTYTLQDALSRIQENARVALDLFIRDVRMAGYTGCAVQTPLANVLTTQEQSRQWMIHVDKGLVGIPAGRLVTTRLDRNAISEAIIVYHADPEASVPVVTHDAGSALITTATAHDFNRGDLLALISQHCEQASVLIAGVNTSRSKVFHLAGGSSRLYNCTQFLAGHFDCYATAGATVFDHSRSQLAPVRAVAYYLRNSNGVPTLYRKRGGETTAGRTHAAEALVEGIEALRIRYGYDTDGDGVANQYRTAAAIGLFSDDWRKVVSVKLDLLVRSIREVTQKPRPYLFADQFITPTDRYLRKAFTTTVALKNRGV